MFFFLSNAEYIPQAITPPSINKSPLLKSKESKLFKSSLVIITKIPKIEINKPDNWKIFVFQFLIKSKLK